MVITFLRKWLANNRCSFTGARGSGKVQHYHFETSTSYFTSAAGNLGPINHHLLCLFLHLSIFSRNKSYYIIRYWQQEKFISTLIESYTRHICYTNYFSMPLLRTFFSITTLTLSHLKINISFTISSNTQSTFLLS